MRRILDRLYLTCGAVAAAAIVAIALLVSTQVVGNLITKMDIPGITLSIPSYADISGYLLAAASFLGLPYTLVKGGHIRVTLLAGRVGPRLGLIMDVGALLVGLAVAAGGAWYMIALTTQSWTYGDMSSGIVPIPIWIVQVPLSVGLTVLAIAFADLLVQTVTTGHSAIVDAQTME